MTPMDKMKALAQISSLAQLGEMSSAAFLIFFLFSCLVCLVAFVVFDDLQWNTSTDQVADIGSIAVPVISSSKTLMAQAPISSLIAPVALGSSEKMALDQSEAIEPDHIRNKIGLDA